RIRGVMERDQAESSLGGLRLRQPNRSQVVLRMECPEDLVAEDHPVRVIWEVTSKLDLSGFSKDVRAREGQSGRDATDPRLLVALWLYASTEGVGSARELDRLCREHRAYQWLCGGVSLNYHTLSDFRVGHGEALDALLTQVLTVLLEQKLVEVWRISQDGTRVRACAGKKRFPRRGRLEELAEQAKAHVEQLRRQLEEPGESAAVTARQRAARQRAARERQGRIEQALQRLPELEQQQMGRRIARAKKVENVAQLRVSTTDADVRPMRMGDGGSRPAVNVQIACDPKSRAIGGVGGRGQRSDGGQTAPVRD